MAMVQDERYLGVIWERSEMVAPLFDTPDRVFRSEAHLMGLFAPGVGAVRDENALVAHSPFPLPADTPLEAGFTLVGGPGGTVVPAIQDYVALRGLPAVPGFPGGFDAAVELLAAGWAHSSGYDGAGKWKHAVWPNFGFTQAADAVVYAQWLAVHAQATDTVAALTAAVAAGRQRLEENDPNYNSGIVHSPWPMGHHVLGRLPAYLQNRLNAGFSQLGLFDEQGIRPYVQQEGRPDFSSTHFANHANGYAAGPLRAILEAAQLTADPMLVEQAIALLDKQTALYAGSVPRGAQTWEIALHTPDIYAAGLLTGCYVMGYELTGREDLLEQARYWAWTGVPFVYLDPSVQGAFGPYATIPVFGATRWVAPVWLGTPVQWCGLVYRNWLLRLAGHDPAGLWKQLADGITASGLLQTWPLQDTERQGLLPDILNLDAQTRAGPAINPGTVQTGLPELFDRGSLYGVRRLHGTHWMAHGPGVLDVVWDLPLVARFTCQGWGAVPYSVHVAGLSQAPEAVLTGPRDAPPESMIGAAYSYDAGRGWLFISNVVGDASFYVATAYRSGDYDADGMPDTWEENEGLAVGQDDASLDPDADGVSNAGEFEADTEPTNGQSVLALREVRFARAGVEVDWQGGPGATQYVEVRNAAAGPRVWAPVFTNEPPTDVVNTWTAAPPSGERGFYRIRAAR
jgi:hypothetical protein